MQSSDLAQIKRAIIATAPVDTMDTDSSTISTPLSRPSESPPSSPLTQFSKSPSPPGDFRLPNGSYLPSPPASQQNSVTRSPTPDSVESGANTDKDEQPPAKRRRISRERTTKYLDLRSGQVDPSQQDELDRLLHVLHRRQKIVVIAGAGISVSAGIPDFRSATGLFRSLKEEHKLKGSGKHLFDASVYKDDTSTSSFHDMVSTMSRLTKDAKPTVFHHLLATLANDGRLLRLYSQNVDGIDTSLEPLRTRIPLTKDESGKWPQTVQLHGGLDTMVCSKCHELSSFNADLFSGPIPPLCPRCEEINDIRTLHEGKRSHGIGRLRPRMVLYNEHNPDDIAIGSVTRDDLRRRPDAVIVVGTTLKVPGVRRIVREMCSVVRNRRDGDAIWINYDLPPPAKDLEDCFDIIVQSPCDEVARLAAMRKWNDPVEACESVEVSDADAEKALSRTAIVHLPQSLIENDDTRRTLTHANMESLPSIRHINNSFSPPPIDVTPKKAIDHPEDWSPMVVPKMSTGALAQNNNTGGKSMAIQKSGLLTPSKMCISFISDQNMPPFKDKLMDKPTKTIRTVSAATQKKPKVPGQAKAPRKSKSLPKTKQEPVLQNSIAMSFKATKPNSFVFKMQGKEQYPAAASKLSHILNPVEPMQAMSPNASPSKTARARFPNLQ